jgi:hypothetical protein
MDAIFVVQSNRVNPVSSFSLLRSSKEISNTATGESFKKLTYELSGKRVTIGNDAGTWIEFHWLHPDTSLEVQFDICLRQLLQASDDIYTFLEMNKDLLLMFGTFQFAMVLHSGLSLVVSRLFAGDDLSVVKLQTGISVVR